MAGAPRIDFDDVYRELEALPEHVTGEVIAGELYTSPRPARRHAVASTGLAVEVGGPFGRGGGDGPGGWVILAEPELHLGADVLVPDLAGWRRERLPDEDGEPAFRTAPDWVCEIASPSTARRDRTVKRDAYARAGVTHLWLVDPHAEVLEVYELRDGLWLLLGSWAGDAVVAVPPFEAMELALAPLWGREVAGGAESGGDGGEGAGDDGGA
jgi:Uma2 family endonuclease